MPDQTPLTATEEARLIAALGGALLVARKARSVDDGLLFQVLTLRDAPDSALEELRDLLSVVQATPALGLFDHAYQCCLGNWEDVDFHFLVEWLISRGQQVGARQAVNDVARYLESETIEITELLAIDGFRVERNIELGECELVAWNHVEMTDTKYQLAARGLFGSKTPTAAVIRRHQIRRVHVRPGIAQVPTFHCHSNQSSMSFVV